MQIEPIAYFRSPFATKFGVPKQSGLVVWRTLIISGLYGNFPPTVTPPPVPLCVRRCLAATAKWECSPRVRRFALTASDSLQCAYRR